MRSELPIKMFNNARPERKQSAMPVLFLEANYSSPTNNFPLVCFWFNYAMGFQWNNYATAFHPQIKMKNLHPLFDSFRHRTDSGKMTFSNDKPVNYSFFYGVN